MERSPEEAAAPPPLLDDEGEIRRAEANGFDLFVGNMGAEVDEAFLTRVFSQFASFVPGSARVKRNADGTTRCYGYVTFAERRDADAAKAEFDDRLVGTRPVRLSVCRRWSEEAQRRLTPEQLMARCEMRKRLFQEQIRRNGGLPSRGAPPLTYYSTIRY
ncbi:hypothetical protein EJB05_54369 [Eragrostis curvula]|uniref:RRM domain-containing protein n=1 Tax=Eragrostis curvula TaxID=38414 RepID=A0A5J9SMJ5_9POAL|nr:hypothetical protein EJB05_54369 [Eragrostis curvula]